jgi:very-short-patch-repair endonuclease
MAQLIRSAPVSAPVAQLRILLPDGSNAYPDFCWPDAMKIVEVDGLHAHSSADRLHNDLQRQNMLMELGWELRRFSARRVRRNPQSVHDEIVRFIDH